jgi:hypothetical protein
MNADAARMLELLAPIHVRLGIPPPAIPEPSPDPFPDQLEIVLEARPAALAFTFGIPPPEALAAVKARGIRMLGTATTPGEARMLAAAGIDAILAQGTEAGGHRGTFAVPFEAAEQVEINLKYRGYIDRQERDIVRLRGSHMRPIPANLDYFSIPGIPRECKERLNAIRPVNFGQAARVSGVRPADIAVLHIYVEKLARQTAESHGDNT